MLNNMLNTNAAGIVDRLNKNDISILDRGFCNAVETISVFGFKCAMPAFLNKKMKLHTTEEANSSSLLQKLR